MKKTMTFEQKCLRFLKEAFHLLAVTLLSLLLPLSFLLLARLFCNSYFNTTNTTPYALFFETNPTLLLGLVASLTVSTLVDAATNGRKTTAVRGPWLYASWVCLCFLQIFVCLGIKASAADEVQGGWNPLGAEESNRRFLSRVAFFVGLHETMRHWTRAVVKPVVDDTVLGGSREEWWPEKVAVALGFGLLWWWRLREEVEALVVVPKVKMELLMGLEVSDFIGWWLYYLTITIGGVKVVKSGIIICRILMDRGLRRKQSRLYEDLHGHEVEYKV